MSLNQIKNNKEFSDNINLDENRSNDDQKRKSYQKCQSA